MAALSYTILVIDDELVGPTSRRSRYESVFGGNTSFKLKYVDQLDGLNTIKSEYADAYLIDMFLERWGGLRASDIMQKYVAFAPRPCPVFLVSARWGESGVTEELKRVLELGEAFRLGSRVRHYFSWDDFSTEESNDLSPLVADRTRSKLIMELDLWHGRSSASIGDGDALRILHISDTQYGDPAFSGDCRLDEEVIGRYLLNNNLSPHLLAITGDVTYSGCPSEFRDAQQGIERLVGSVFDCATSVDPFRERILLVPGNHDVNLRMGSCGYYDYASFAKGSERPTLERHSQGNALSLSEWHNQYQAYSWKPFREFASSLTWDRRWLDPTNQNLYWLSNRFGHWGVQFMMLNTARAINCTAPSKAAVCEDDLKPFYRDMRENPSQFKIALGHHGREELGGDKEDGAWRLLSGFLATNDVRLFLHGHRHESKGEYCSDNCFRDPLNISLAPSLTLNSKARREGSLRGFNVIQLNRVSGQINGGEIKQFEIREKQIHPGHVRQVLPVK